jgi:hypothetical protein
VGAPVGNTANLTIAGGAGVVVDTFRTIGTTGAGYARSRQRLVQVTGDVGIGVNGKGTLW